uniref:PQ-loop repeat-containing protein 1 n=1 Tax=Bursaphelenchus xylophilus TaxID=6326 RepID=A0A1I7S876_BURXY
MEIIGAKLPFSYEHRRGREGHLFSAFWKWNDLSSFIVALIGFSIVSAGVTYFFSEVHCPAGVDFHEDIKLEEPKCKPNLYIEGLGLVAVLTEACLGLPQLIRNFQRHSTQGMSVNMVLMWLLGDVGKTLYFIFKQTPAQFWICGCLQITIDILILGQVYFYNRGTARIPTYVPSSQAKL